MSFDVDGARRAGYSDKDIAEYLAPRRNFNIGGAREAGYSDADIVSYLMSRPAPAGREAVAPTQATEPPAPAPERGFFGSVASMAGDTGASLVTGAGSALSGIGGLGGVAGLGYDNMLSRAGRRVSEFGEGLMSPELVEKRQALSRAIQDAESQGLVGEARAALSTLASNPSLLFSMAIEQIPAFVLSGGVGRGASAIGQVAARRAAVGGGEAAEQAILQAGQRAGQVAAVGTAAGLQGGGVAEETYQDVMRLPGETLQRSPVYQELLRSMSPDEARSTIADRAAREAGLLGGGVSVATMSLMPSAEKAMFSRGVSQSAIRRALGVGAGEATSEGIEEGGGQFAQNLAIQRRADEQRSLTQGVGGAAATGAVLGGIMGGGIGAIQRPPVPPSTEPGAGNLPSDLRGAIEDYVANREPETPDLADRVRLVTENLPVTAEQFLGATARDQDILIRRAQREAEGRAVDDVISGQAGSRAEAFRFEEGRSEPMDDGRTQAEFFRERAEEMAREARPTPGVAADEAALREARRTQFVDPGTSAERTVRAAQEARAEQTPTSPFFPLVENFIEGHVRTYGDAEPISVPALQQYVKERTGRTVGLEQAQGILDTYYNASSQRGIPSGQGWVLQRDTVEQAGTTGEPSGVPGERMPPRVAFGPGAQVQNVYRAVAPRGANTDEAGRPMTPPQPSPSIPTDEYGFARPQRGAGGQTAEASARAAGAEQTAPQAEVEPSEADARLSRRVQAQDKINALYLDKLKGMGAQGRLIRNGLVDALRNRTMSAQEVYASFTASDMLAQVLPPTANHRIQFVKRLVAPGSAAERSGGVSGQEVQGLRFRPERAGLQGLIQISLAPDQLAILNETAAHEAFHVLQDYYGQYDPQFKKLMDQGFRDGMRISDVDPTIRRKLEQARMPNSRQTYWEALTGSLPNAMTAREAQAYAFGALMDASRRGVPMTGLKPAFARFVGFIKNFFSKLGSKLRGDGFQTVEEVLGRAGREGGRRFADRATPTAADMAAREPELSARTSSVELRKKPPAIKGTGAGGTKLTVKDIGEYFDATNERTDPNDPAAMQDAIDSALDELSYQLAQENTGEKWYEEDVADAFATTARIIPELNDVDHRRLFSAYAALLSNGTRAGANWENAAVGYQEFLKTGQFPEQRPGKGTGWTGLRSGVTAQQIRMLNMLLKRPEFANDPIGGLNNWLLTPHPVSEIQDFRNGTKIFSGDLSSIGTRKDQRMGAYILGPKFGPFMLNINGIQDTTTDSWFTRTFNRHFGRMTGPGAVGDAGLVDQPRSPAERKLMKDTFTAELAKKLGKTDQAIQAILWYYEQQLFYAMGVKSARSESFSDGARKFAGSRPAEARSPGAEGAARGDAGRAARKGDRAEASARLGLREAGAQEGLSEEQFEASARATNTTVPEFKNWWNGGWRGEGVQVGPSEAFNIIDGLPTTFYHGTQRGFTRFGEARSGSYGREGPYFFSPSPNFAGDYALSEMYAGGGGQPAMRGQRMLPVYLSIQRPFKADDPQSRQELLDYVDRGMDDGTIDWRDIVGERSKATYQEQIDRGEVSENRIAGRAFRMFKLFLESESDNWPALETRAAQRYIRESGYDSFYVRELGTENIAVYDPRQIKSVFNRFEAGAALEPEFSARAPFQGSPLYQTAVEDITGKKYDKPGIFSEALRRFTGALPGEKNSSALVRTMVNRAAPGWMLDRLAKEKGLSMRSVGLALEVALNNSGRVQMYLDHGPLGYDPKTGDVKVREDVPGLVAAIKGRLDIKDKEKAQAYLVALRERDLRKAGKKGFFNLTDQKINTIISESEASRPEWKEMAADIQRINKALLDFAVATGTLDRSKADQLGSMFYTPFYRQADEDGQKNANEVVGPRLSDSLTRVKTAFDVSLKGGENPLGDLFENMIRNADVIMKAGMKNVAMRQAAEVMDAVGLGRPSKERVSGKTITYRVDGQDKNFEVDDPVLYTALAGAPRHVTNGIYQTMANFAGFFRDMITLAPSFMLANLWRGKIMAYVQEGVPFYANTFDGLRQALKSSASYKAIAAQTGFGGYTYGMGERDASAAFEREIGGLGYGPKGLWYRFTQPLQKASEATEMAERIKLYERAKAQGMTDKEAAFQAYLLAPFSRRGMGGGWAGDSVNFFVPLVPFLNAKIQGMYRLIENEKGDTQKLWTLGIPKQMLLRGLVVMAASLALASKNMADEPERWEDENPDMKFRYDIIYLPNDKRILLPRAFEVGSVFGALPVFLLDAWRRDDSRDLSKVLTDLGMSTFFFNPIPAAAVPLIGAATNYDFFRARALETAGDRSKLPEERVNRSTSAVARIIGEQAGISPIRVQYVLEGYSGTIGATVLAGLDSIWASMGLIPNKPAGAFGDPMSMPAIIAGLTGANRFYRSDDQTASRFVGDFYKIKEMTDQLVRSQNMATESRDLDRLAELRGEAGLPLRLRPMVNQASTQINEINKRMARIERSDLDSVSKADALRPLREQRDRVAKRVVERARQIGAY